MRIRSLNLGEIAVALLVILLGVFMIWEASGYPFGSLRRMGPGFFPVWLGVVLILFGAALLLEVSFLEVRRLAVPVRALVLVPLGLVAFALMVEPFGLVPATFVLIVLSALASRPVRLQVVFWTAVVVTAMGYLVFLRGFGIPLDAIGWHGELSVVRVNVRDIRPLLSHR